MDCLSWDAPKIASEIMINFFCNGDKEKISNFKKEKYWFKNFVVGDYLPKIEFKTKVFQDVYNEACKSTSGFKKTLLFKRFDGTYLKIQYGSGGIHTVNSFEKFKSTNDLIISSDVESLYPTLFINNQFIRKSLRSIIEIFANIKADRVKAKAEGLKTENETLKLILNSFTGILDNQYSPFYSPEYIMALRIYGQLLMTRFAEECDINKFLVVSQNTDGHEVIVPKERLNEYLELCERIEKEFTVKFEHHKYKFIYYHTVNSYLALSEKGKVITTQDFNSSNEIFENEIDGMEDENVEYEVKLKDESDYQDKLDGANEYLIIALALKEKFVNGIEFSETIRNCKKLQMFTASKKSAKKYEVIYNGQKVQRLNRYFVSLRNKGGFLFKKGLVYNKKYPKEAKYTLNAIMKGQAVYLVNEDIRNADPKDYPIDYSWYERKCQERYQKFYSNQLTLA